MDRKYIVPDEKGQCKNGNAAPVPVMLIAYKTFMSSHVSFGTGLFLRKTERILSVC